MSSVTLTVRGMTCASCAARIETNLNRIDGVAANVNFATEQAKVEIRRTSLPRIRSPLWRRPATPRHWTRDQQLKRPTRRRRGDGGCWCQRL